MDNNKDEYKPFVSHIQNKKTWVDLLAFVMLIVCLGIGLVVGVTNG